jgi:WD40 repeat protein
MKILLSLLSLILVAPPQAPHTRRPAPAISQAEPGRPRLVTQPNQFHGTDWLAFSADGALLVSTNSTTATAIVWDVKSGRELRRFTRNTNYSGYVQNKYIVAGFSPDAKRLAVLNVRQQEVRIWDIATGHLLKLMRVANLL